MAAAPAKLLGATTFRECITAIAGAGREHPPLVAVEPTTPIAECLAIMGRHKILSVPVKSRVTVPAQCQYSAMISCFDLIACLIKEGASATQPVENAFSLDATSENYRVWERDVDDTLSETLSAFSKGIHRALLTSIAQPSKPALVFTQSDVLRYVLINPQSVTSKLDLVMPLSKLIPNAKHAKMHFVKSTDSALQAFTSMWDKQVQALPVVDPSGKIVATISAASLRGIQSANINEQLKLSVLDFIKHQNDGQVPAPATCTLETSLNEVISSLIKGKLHRVWVVQGQECIGVVSLTDIIRLIVQSGAAAAPTH